MNFNIFNYAIDEVWSPELRRHRLSCFISFNYICYVRFVVLGGGAGFFSVLHFSSVLYVKVHAMHGSFMLICYENFEL